MIKKTEHVRSSKSMQRIMCMEVSLARDTVSFSLSFRARHLSNDVYSRPNQRALTAARLLAEGRADSTAEAGAEVMAAADEVMLASAAADDEGAPVWMVAELLAKTGMSGRPVGAVSLVVRLLPKEVTLYK